MFKDLRRELRPKKQVLENTFFKKLFAHVTIKFKQSSPSLDKLILMSVACVTFTVDVILYGGLQPQRVGYTNFSHV